MEANPPLRLLQTFHRVAAAGSFTGAAVDLGITQPAVSQQIRELETILGVELFRRTGRGVEPTSAGRQLVGTTGTHIAAIERSLGAIRARAQDHHVEVRANSTFATTWLVPRLPGFLRAHPEVEVDLTSSYWNYPIDPVHAAVQIDFGPVRQEAEPIGGDEVVLAVASPRVARGIRSAEDLGANVLLDIRGGDGWTEFGAATGISVASSRVHTSMTYLHTLALARAGVGIALAHRFLAADDLHAGTLAVVPIGQAAAREQYQLVPPRPDRTTSAAHLFLAWLRGELAAPAVDG
ncbi:MAG: LysR family transcriptional regulator [Actinomycetota bacterium]